MRNLIFTAVAVAGLAAGGSVFAQASGFDAASSAGNNAASAPNPAAITPYGPVPGTPEYYGNSGWTPDKIYGDNLYPYGYQYGYPGAAAPAWRPPYRSDSRGLRDRRTRSDRDGDGVPNNRDRYPNDPSRW